MSNHYALLIGVDHYFEYRLPGGTYYPKLGGCVRDIKKIYNFLTQRIGLDTANITMLAATLGGAKPQEPESQWPTYTNMVNAFAKLTNRVTAGDQVYIQYSGHGGRTTTMFPKIKGEGEFDEGLVPLDIGKPNDPDARYLRDAEIHELLKRLVDKGVRLTVVFDCCHSGGATRDLGGAVKRGIGQPDTSPAPADSKVAPLSELIANWQGIDAATSRGLHSQSEWRFETKGYTLFAACRANESAFEYPFDGRESNGALTYWLVDTLSNAGPEFTWKMAADRVTAKVHGQFAAQTPMLQGEIDYKVFGHDRLSNDFAVAVLEVKPGRVRLAAGEAHGLKTGIQFAIYPVGTTDFNNSSERTTLVTVDQVEDVSAWATVAEGTADAIEIGAQAVMLSTTDVKLQSDVRIEIEDATLRNQIESAIQHSGRGFVAIAKDDSPDEFVIQIVNDEFVIADTTGEPLPNLQPALQRDDPSAPRQLVDRLVHLIQYHNVLSLDMPDATARAKLQVELQSPPPPIRPGDQITLKITNTQEPNPRDLNDPQLVLNIAVLSLSSDWSISQIYPGSAAFEPVDPGKSIALEFEAYLPEGQQISVDTLKVFATQSTTDFRWLELPPLDQPQSSARSKATRSTVTDPLEQLLAATTGAETATRQIRFTSARQEKSWTTTQVELRVER